MNLCKTHKLATCIKLACVFMFLMTGTACSYDPLTITGRVVDESGNSLSDVSVWACYSGWGWGEGGYLVWDKNYCSEITQTNLDGDYLITFKGPVSSRLWAKKEGWVQTKDFNTTRSHIVLTRSEDYSARLRAETKQRDLEQRRHRAEESTTEYYCRLILPEVQTVNVTYQDEKLAVTPTLLKSDNQNDAFFAVRGSLRAVKAFSEEAVFLINGEAQGSNLSLASADASCNQDVHFVGVDFPNLDAWPVFGVEMFIPSINAMFETKIQRLSTQQ